MKKSLLAAAFAAAVFPASVADAAGPATTFTRTYTLSCAVNSQDGAALKVRMMVKNTTGRVIKQGTKIELRVYTSRGFRYLYTVAAYRDVAINDSIGLDQRSGARSCSARVTLPRYDKGIMTRVTR